MSKLELRKRQTLRRQMTIVHLKQRQSQDKSGTGNSSTKSKQSGFDQRMILRKENTTSFTKLSQKMQRILLPTLIFPPRVRSNSKQYSTFPALLLTISLKTTTGYQVLLSCMCAAFLLLRSSLILCQSILTSSKVLLIATTYHLTSAESSSNK